VIVTFPEGTIGPLAADALPEVEPLPLVEALAEALPDEPEPAEALAEPAPDPASLAEPEPVAPEVLPLEDCDAC
jgi:hypothetical protein